MKTTEESATAAGAPVRLGGGALALLAGAIAALLFAAPASAQPGLPRSYDYRAIDSPAPVNGGAFGWGVASADLTGDGKADLLIPQAQAQPTRIFIFDGATGQNIETLNPPEANPDGSDPVIGFVYVEVMPDVGSCPSGDGADGDRICDDALVGAPDGIPEISVGARELQVDADPGDDDGTTRDASDPKLGRGYIVDGATRAVLKRIDMPVADRIQEAGFGAQPQFGRVMTAPQGLPPCDGTYIDRNGDVQQIPGAAGELNDLGVGPCPLPTDGDPDSDIDTDPIYPQAVRVGDVNGDGFADLVLTARNYRESVGSTGTAAPGSQCFTATSGTCTGGRAWVYSGAVAGSDPEAIDETPLYTVKNPFAQTTSGTEFGGNVWRIGDVGGGSGGAPDGAPDFVVAARNTSYPLASPDTNTQPAVGVAYLFSGANGSLLTTYPHPQPQPRATFSASFNAGRPAGDLGLTGLPDVVLPAPLQNVELADEGIAYVLRGDQSSAGGGGQGGWQFAQMRDPNPVTGGGFGSSTTGVGDLVGGPAAGANEMMIGSWAPFDPFTEPSETMIGTVHIVNPQSGTNLQTIADPTGERGSGFGVGMTPMGDLNGDGFLDFAVTAYLSGGLTGFPAAQGRAYVFTSDNTPPPEPPGKPRPGKCANEKVGTGARDVLRGTAFGDELFALAGNDRVIAMGGDDCADGGRGADSIFGGRGKDALIGKAGRDLVAGGAGADLLFGFKGNDLIKGGKGRDALVGGAGRDVIRARDGRTDRIACGGGFDRVYANPGDRVRVDCERVLLP